jgi:hypothetical protein
MWLVTVPLAFQAAGMVIVAVGMLENYRSVFLLMLFVSKVTPLYAFNSYVASIGCMAYLAWKWRTAASKDARRSRV